MRPRAVGLLVLSLMLPRVAMAVCQPAPGQLFAQYYHHVRSPGTFTPESMTASFWALGFGNPAVNAGVDSGSLTDESWIVPYFTSTGLGLSIMGTWAQSQAIDGCIEGKIAPGKSSEIMIVQLADRLHYDASQFAIAAVAKTSHPDEYPRFDFSEGIGRDITLANVPKPFIVSSDDIVPHTIRLVVSGPTTTQLAGGFYSDGSVSLSEVIAGYRLYFQPLTFGAPTPDVRPDVGWTPLTGTVPIGQLVTVSIECTHVYEFLALSLVYENGLESPYLSSKSTTIKCEMCSGDIDRDGTSGNPSCGAFDCDEADANTHPGAVETNDGKDNQCAGDSGFGIIDEVDGLGRFATPGDKTSLSWPAQAGATGYQVGRSSDPTLTASCTSFLSGTPSLTDPDLPQPNSAFYYLIRATAPHLGSWGKTSAGLERSTVCP